MKKKIISVIFRIGFSLALIAYFIFKISKQFAGSGGFWHNFWEVVSHISVNYVILCLCLHIVGFILITWRWKILLEAQGYSTRFLQLFLFYFRAAFFNVFMVSTIGGDAVRVYDSQTITGETTRPLAVVIIERLIGMLALVLLSFAGLLIKLPLATIDDPRSWLLLLVVLAAFVLFMIISHPRIVGRIVIYLKRRFPGKISTWIETAYQAVAVLYRKPKTFLAVLGLSVVSQFNIVVYYYFLTCALGIFLPPIDFLIKAPLMIFLLMTVPSVNGIGVRAGSFNGLLAINASKSFALDWLDVCLKVFYGLIGGVVFLLYKPQKKDAQF